jgi:FtsP/CotA-like multicopper oxidase with cupredoxin domain
LYNRAAAPQAPSLDVTMMDKKLPLDRRSFLKISGLAAFGPGMSCFARSAQGPLAGANADYTLRIGSARVELSPEHIISTTTYNGQFPGPLLRLTEGRRVVVDIHNDTDAPEQLHWHGQNVAVDVDGAAEEGTPYIPAHDMRRISFMPGPPGLRFYHSHLIAGGDLAAGLYSGQAGAVYIEPRREQGRFDREVILVLKEFSPTLSRGGDMAMDFLVPATTDHSLQQTGEAAMAASLERGMPHGYEVGYKLFSINGRMLGHGEPLRVKAGERVLFHILNASATEIRSLALPGHLFTVVALDGNPVPVPAQVQVLWLGTAERVSATVEMNHPGVWIFGDLADADREHGMGMVVEYAGVKGKPRWIKPIAATWDYTRFGQGAAQAPDETIEMVFAKHNAALNGFNQWTINGTAFSMQKMSPMFHLRRGSRYRLRMRNASDDIHPVHLHRHSFELTKIAGKATAGVMKDVVMLGGYQQIEVDFTADNPGLTLFHCHQQLHMDFGFMALFNYI